VTDKPSISPRFDKFREAVSELQSLLNGIDRARELPRDYAYEVNRVEIYASSGYAGQRSDRSMQAATAIKQQTIDAMRAEGEKARDAKLAEIALAIGGLRGLIPDMAAQASIELGRIARELAIEAKT
jgi:hypothetical protein